MKYQDVKHHCEALFAQRYSLLTLWQTMAENFYPERADFTVTRSLGDEFTDNLTTSYPILARRDLAGTFSGMLRPSDKQWFFMRPVQDWRDDNESQRWLDWATELQTNAMYDPVANFVRATKEGDNDFATFGQCAISVELNRRQNALLYRCWHLRDVAWSEGPEGKPDMIARKSPMEGTNVKKIFKQISPRLEADLKKDPLKKVNVMHMVVPTDQYQSGDIKKEYKTPYISIYYDCDHDFILEENGSHNRQYVIPRWQTVPGSQYAYSPSTVASLPDARLMQAMTLTLLEAGEKAASPPMVAVQEAIRSDISLFAGGITWVDPEYDERLGEVLRPLNQDFGGIPIGIEMQRDIRAQISEAFYLNKIGLPPPTSADMTAFEVGQRVQEWIRNALPLFEPAEMEYNGGICEITFDILLRAGAFGSANDIPESLRGADIHFKFESPLTRAREQQKSQKFLETKAMLSEAAQLDPSAAQMIDVPTALRDVLTSIGSPSKWVRTEEEMAELQEQAAQQQQTEQLLAGLTQGGVAAESLANAGKTISEIQQ